jgi:SAM-dependent methyltransferase
MAHFAQIDETGVVVQVIVVSNSEINDLPFPESEPIGVSFCQSLFGADTYWLQTSYSGSFRKNYAGIGWRYVADKDVFVAAQPYPSWTLNRDCIWQAPVAYPDDGLPYYWDEASLTWARSYTPWVPTPDAVIEKVMEVAALTASDTFLDVGSGDGRVLAAASKYTSNLRGVDIDSGRVAETLQAAPGAVVEQGDAVLYDASGATVAYMYALNVVNYLLPRLLLHVSKVIYYVEDEDAFLVSPQAQIALESGGVLYVWDKNSINQKLVIEPEAK